MPILQGGRELLRNCELTPIFGLFGPFQGQIQDFHSGGGVAVQHISAVGKSGKVKQLQDGSVGRGGSHPLDPPQFFSSQVRSH